MIAVITCKRPSGVDYLASTLAQIDEAPRRFRRIVFSDRGSAAVPPGWENVVHSYVPPWKGKPENKWIALMAISEAARTGEDLCLFEDDIQFCPGAVAEIEGMRVPDDLAWVTFFSPWLGPGATTPDGLWRSSVASTFVMAQALKIPARTCAALAAIRADEARWPRYGVVGSDELLAAIGREERWRYGIVKPNLVQHIGADSAVGNGELRGIRVSPTFLGKDVTGIFSTGDQRFE